MKSSTHKTAGTQLLRPVLTAALACTLGFSSFAIAADPTHVAKPNPKSPGMAAPNILSPELVGSVVAQGSMPVEQLTKTAVRMQALKARVSAKMDNIA